MHVDEIVQNIGDRIHRWPVDSMLDRLELYDVCFAGLCESPYLSGAGRVRNMIALEGMAEEIGGLPLPGGWNDQLNVTVQAFAIIRSTRNAIHARNVEAAKSGVK